MPKSKQLRQKTPYDVILVKFWSKTAQISKSDFGNLKTGKLFVTLATSNFRELFVIKFDSKSSCFEIKIVLWKGFITKKMRGVKISTPHEEKG